MIKKKKVTLKSVQSSDGQIIDDAKAPGVKTLRRISPIAFTFERAFFLLSQITPERIFSPTRVTIQDKFGNSADRVLAADKRGLKTEVYMLLWLFIEFCTVIFGTGQSSAYVTLPLCVLMSIRILDIIQITANISLFDRLKVTWKVYYVENTVRSIVLSLLNYLELVVCFGYLYCVLGRNEKYLRMKESIFDGYYFSGITQLTIGYGDMTPSGPVKYLALVQGFIGFIFTILILARFIALLPELKEEVR